MTHANHPSFEQMWGLRNEAIDAARKAGQRAFSYAPAPGSLAFLRMIPRSLIWLVTTPNISLPNNTPDGRGYRLIMYRSDLYHWADVGRRITKILADVDTLNNMTIGAHIDPNNEKVLFYAPQQSQVDQKRLADPHESNAAFHVMKMAVRDTIVPLQRA